MTPRSSMYLPPLMAERDPDKIRQILGEFPFATLMSWQPTLHITHVPLMADAGKGALKHVFGHMARANPHGAAMTTRPPAVAIFQGPHGYVSPTWYRSPGLVPTWNYVAVHVHGTLQRLDDPGEVESVVARQVAMFEGGDAQAWRPAPETLARKLEGVTAFRLDVERVEAKLKLGQNRKLADRVAARVALGGAPRESDRELAAWMKSTEPDDDRRD